VTAVAQFDKSFTLQVPSSTENLALIREFVCAVGDQAGFDEKDVMRLQLAVDEACANVIEHAYALETTHEVTIRAVMDDDALRFEIVDHGKGFDPANIDELQLDQLIKDHRSGGLGLRLIRSVMDDVQYQIIPGEKNELRMVKRLKKQA
jgi:anti-sigma regulatory factor (Ser/Thr protein kinase)